MEWVWGGSPHLQMGATTEGWFRGSSGKNCNTGSGFGVLGLGFGFWVLGFGVWGLGFSRAGSGAAAGRTATRVRGLGFGVWGLGLGVWS